MYLYRMQRAIGDSRGTEEGKVVMVLIRDFSRARHKAEVLDPMPALITNGGPAPRAGAGWPCEYLLRRRNADHSTHRAVHWYG